jgi:hypothetical protein
MSKSGASPDIGDDLFAEAKLEAEAAKQGSI